MEINPHVQLNYFLVAADLREWDGERNSELQCQ
jgi:hypothetical protein